VYHLSLVNDLLVLLEHEPLHQGEEAWFMRGGAPPHFLRTVRQHLNETFGEQWMKGEEDPENACQEIRLKPGCFDRMLASVQRRAGSCVKMHGKPHRAPDMEIIRTSPICQQAC
jgi:hypothetical protein